MHNIIMESEHIIIITIDSDKQVANLKVQFVLVSIRWFENVASIFLSSELSVQLLGTL